MHESPAIETLISGFFIVLAFSVLVVFLSHKLRLSTVVGLLLTGMLIGPSGLRLVQSEEVKLFAELGVILLLFTVGLEVSLVRLRNNWRSFFIGGGMQVGLTVAATAAIALAFGIAPRNAVFLGFLAALSSTAIVLKAYGERRELQSPQGTLAAAILLFQDFALAPMIMLVPVLAGAAASTASEVVMRLLMGVVLVAVVFGLARTLMPQVLGLMVKTRVREVFVLGALAICLGMALVTAKLGFSLALGAFLAGLLISESKYSHQVIAEVLPIRDVFNSLFFISVGMLLNFDAVGSIMPQVLGLGAGILVGKFLIVLLVAAFLSYPARIAFIVAISLAQVGEFSFVLGGLGMTLGLLDGRIYQAFLGASILTMLITPLLIQVAPRVASHVRIIRVPGPLQRLRVGGARSSNETAGLTGHVVVVGYGLNGHNLSRVLQEAAIPFLVVELNGQRVQEAHHRGVPVLYGDATRTEILLGSGIQDASMLVVAISDHTATRQVVKEARQFNAGLHILVRTRTVSDVEELVRLGANEVIPEEFETSVEIFSRVLDRYHVPKNIIRAQASIIRGERYEMLRVGPQTTQPAMDRIGELLEATLTETFLVPSKSPADGKSLRELDLRHRSGGATVIAVVRDGKATTNPSADMQLQANDNIVLVGDHAALGEAEALLQDVVVDAAGEAKVTSAHPDPDIG